MLNQESVLELTIVLLMIFVYFLPSIYSRFKKDDKFAIILFLNVIFGATVIGWIVLFIWVIKRSVTGERNSTRQPTALAMPTGKKMKSGKASRR
jgi:hypothetical protein